MEHHAPAGSLTSLNSPLAIAALSFVAAIGGGFVRDRISVETRDTATETRLQALSDRVAAIEQSAVPAAQFREYQDSTSRRLDEIRQDLRDVKKLLSRP